MDTPQGTFYRVYFDIYLTLDGSEFNAELVCQGEVMGRCTARFRQGVFCEEKKSAWLFMMIICEWLEVSVLYKQGFDGNKSHEIDEVNILQAYPNSPK